jgi:hypothetical protein
VGLGLRDGGASCGGDGSGLPHAQPRVGHGCERACDEENERGWEQYLVLTDPFGERAMCSVHPAEDDNQGGSSAFGQNVVVGRVSGFGRKR